MLMTTRRAIPSTARGERVSMRSGTSREKIPNTVWDVQHVRYPEAAYGISVGRRNPNGIALVVEVKGRSIVDFHDRIARIVYECEVILRCLLRTHKANATSARPLPHIVTSVCTHNASPLVRLSTRDQNISD